MSRNEDFLYTRKNRYEEMEMGVGRRPGADYLEGSSGMAAATANNYFGWYNTHQLQQKQPPAAKIPLLKTPAVPPITAVGDLLARPPDIGLPSSVSTTAITGAAPRGVKRSALDDRDYYHSSQRVDHEHVKTFSYNRDNFDVKSNKYAKYEVPNSSSASVPTGYSQKNYGDGNRVSWNDNKEFEGRIDLDQNLNRPSRGDDFLHGGFDHPRNDNKNSVVSLHSGGPRVDDPQKLPRSDGFPRREVLPAQDWGGLGRGIGYERPDVPNPENLSSVPFVDKLGKEKFEPVYRGYESTRRLVEEDFTRPNKYPKLSIGQQDDLRKPNDGRSLNYPPSTHHMDESRSSRSDTLPKFDFPSQRYNEFSRQAQDIDFGKHSSASDEFGAKYNVDHRLDSKNSQTQLKFDRNLNDSSSRITSDHLNVDSKQRVYSSWKKDEPKNNFAVVRPSQIIEEKLPEIEGISRRRPIDSSFRRAGDDRRSREMDEIKRGDEYHRSHPIGDLPKADDFYHQRQPIDRFERRDERNQSRPVSEFERPYDYNRSRPVVDELGRSDDRNRIRPVREFGTPDDYNRSQPADELRRPGDLNLKRPVADPGKHYDWAQSSPVDELRKPDDFFQSRPVGEIRKPDDYHKSESVGELRRADYYHESRPVVELRRADDYHESRPIAAERGKPDDFNRSRPTGKLGRATDCLENQPVAERVRPDDYNRNRPIGEFRRAADYHESRLIAERGRSGDRGTLDDLNKYRSHDKFDSADEYNRSRSVAEHGGPDDFNRSRPIGELGKAADYHERRPVIERGRPNDRGRPVDFDRSRPVDELDRFDDHVRSRPIGESRRAAEYHEKRPVADRGRPGDFHKSQRSGEYGGDSYNEFGTHLTADGDLQTGDFKRVLFDRVSHESNPVVRQAYDYQKDDDFCAQRMDDWRERRDFDDRLDVRGKPRPLLSMKPDDIRSFDRRDQCADEFRRGRYHEGRDVRQELKFPSRDDYRKDSYRNWDDNRQETEMFSSNRNFEERRRDYEERQSRRCDLSGQGSLHVRDYPRDNRNKTRVLSPRRRELERRCPSPKRGTDSKKEAFVNREIADRFEKNKQHPDHPRQDSRPKTNPPIKKPESLVDNTKTVDESEKKNLPTKPIGSTGKEAGVEEPDASKNEAEVKKDTVVANVQKKKGDEPLTLDAVKGLSGVIGSSFLVMIMPNENPLSTLQRSASIFNKNLNYTIQFDIIKKIWKGSVRMTGKHLLSIEDSDKPVAREKVLTGVVKMLQRQYYTLKIKAEYNAKGLEVFPDGEIRPKLSRNKVYQRFRHESATPANMKKLYKIIDEYAANTDTIDDLVFSFKFNPFDRKLLKDYTKSHHKRLRIRKFGPNKFKFLVLSKEFNVWTIIEGLINKEEKYFTNFQLCPPTGV